MAYYDAKINFFMFFFLILGGWLIHKHGAEYCSASASLGPLAPAAHQWTSQPHVNCCIWKCRVSKIFDIVPVVFYFCKNTLGNERKIAKNRDCFIFQLKSAWKWARGRRKVSVSGAYRPRFILLLFIHFFCIFFCTSNTESDLPQSIIK